MVEIYRNFQNFFSTVTVGPIKLDMGQSFPNFHASTQATQIHPRYDPTVTMFYSYFFICELVMFNNLEIVSSQILRIFLETI